MKMNAKIAEIEARKNAATDGPINAHRISQEAFIFSNPNGMTKADAILFCSAKEYIIFLLSEVRRLQAVVEKYANRENWVRSVNTNGVFMDLWLYDEHGYTIAEECLREDGE